MAVSGVRVRVSQDDFRGSVRAGLDVRASLVVMEVGVAVVDDFDLARAERTIQYRARKQQ